MLFISVNTSPVFPLQGEAGPTGAKGAPGPKGAKVSVRKPGALMCVLIHTGCFIDSSSMCCRETEASQA